MTKPSLAAAAAGFFCAGTVGRAMKRLMTTDVTFAVRSRPFLAATLAALSTSFGFAAQSATYDATVEANNPLAYYNLGQSNATTTIDAVNGFTMTLNNGATVQPGAGPTINGSSAPALVLNSNTSGTAFAGSGGAKPEMGGISSAGSVIAWINLAELPSTAGRIFSIAGTSAGGDDFDLQIDPSDNQLRFFTDSGSFTGSTTDFTSSSLGQWIMVAGTFTAGTMRDVYINGVSAGGTTDGSTLTPGGHFDSGAPFYIGQSNVFGGRNFIGSIADVAFFNTDLTSAQIGSIFASATAPAALPGVPEPATWAMMLVGFGGLGAAMRRSRRRAARALA